MPQFPASISLATLDGTNGFRIDGSYAGDFSGRSVASAGDVNGDGFGDLIVGAFGGAPGGDSYEGVSYVVFGKASGFAAALDLSTLNSSNGFRLDGIDGNDRSGFSVASAGDVNGDGFDDVIIGAFGGDPGGDSFAGESYVVFGKASGFAAAVNLGALDGTNGFRLDGIDGGDYSGRSVGSAGDVNGDGFADLIVGAYGGDPGGDTFAGESYVVFGKASGFAAALDLASLDGTTGFRLDGIDASDYSGRSVASAGDVNGDGIGDLIVGADGGDPGGDSGAGESYVVFGKASGFAAALDLGALDGANGFRLDGIDAVDQSGRSVGSAGDVNGDGFSDLIVGAFGGAPGGDALAGESYVVFGKASGFAAAFDLASLDGANGFRLDGIDAMDFSGGSVASAGDVNGDGFGDLIVGADGADPGGDLYAGESYVVFGKASGFAAALDLASLDGANGFRLDGIDASDFSGRSVASAGDVNGDGFDDILIGAPEADPGGDFSAGESYVVFGHATGTLNRTGTDARDILSGGEWDDTFSGLGGDDWIRSGAGNDIVYGGQGADRLDGGDDDDRIDGGSGDDNLTGGDGDDTILGGAGVDAIAGGNGNDILKGGSGKDVFTASAGEDQIDGGSEKDQITFASFGSSTPVTVDLETGAFLHPNGEDLQSLVSVEDVVGTGGADTIAGNFVINTLNGAQGADSIDGAGGNDLVVGGGGKDTLNGGAGGDRFDYNSVSESAFGSATRDVVQDFTVDPVASSAFVDRLDFSSLDAQTGTAGNQTFAFIGTGGFTAEGQIRAFQSGGNTIVQANVTGVTGAELEVQLVSFTATTLQAADFVL